MYPFIDFCGKVIPSYGILIALGIVVANVMMYFKVEKEFRLDFFVLEGYILLGGILGAKILYLLVSIGQINWSRWNDIDYVLSILKGGFVFYGGLIGGVIGCYFAGKIHKLHSYKIIERVIFGVPLAHGFGRVGCFMAGCCYGFQYNGIFAVTYPEISFGPSGVSCFPIQLLEAFLLWGLALIVYLASKKNKYNPIGVYLIGYAVIRFFLEYFRADAARGAIGDLSTSQLISILIFGISIEVIGIRKKKAK